MRLRLSARETRRVLPRPAQNARARWSIRAAHIITLQSDTGARGSGEAAPLPGFSRDTLAACQGALRALDLSGLPERLEPGEAVLDALAAASSRLPSTLPAARAALESALLELWARAAGVPAWALLRGDSTPPRSRRVAALLMDEPEHALEQARSARARGVTAFKLKVGRPGALERELRACASLRAELGPAVDLRLDANRAWPAPAARSELLRFSPYQPEFAEEPCALAGFGALAPAPVPLALDESLLELSVEDRALAELVELGVRAVILKPTLLGGISVCAAWARVARACGATVVLSHAFEGPLGLALSATLALALGSEHAAHGLDLEGAQLEPNALPFFSAGEIHAWAAPGFGDLEQGP